GHGPGEAWGCGLAPTRRVRVRPRTSGRFRGRGGAAQEQSRLSDLPETALPRGGVDLPGGLAERANSLRHPGVPGMCGICGAVWTEPKGALAPESLQAMLDRLVHRGPDDAGVYRDNHAALGFRRLSIIDLAGGHQPLSNEDGTVWTVFNGEIYNYSALRRRLEAKGHTLRSSGDSEVLVHLYDDEGTRTFPPLPAPSP